MDKFMKHLEHNMPSEELIDKRRIMILAQILRKIDSIVKVPDQYQKLSYVLSEKYKGEFDFMYYIFHSLIRVENGILRYGEKHLYYEDGRHTFVECFEEDEEESTHAAISREDKKARFKFFLNVMLITWNGEPLNKSQEIIYAGGLQGDRHGEHVYIDQGVKTLFGTDLHRLDKKLEELGSVTKINLIELRNMLAILLLYEHELCHAIIATYRFETDWESTELATPKDYPRLNRKTWGKRHPNFHETKYSYTNDGGHGPLFCRLVNGLFAHYGIHSILDVIPYWENRKSPKKCSCVVAARRPEDYETCPKYLNYGPKFQKEVKKAIYADVGFKFLSEGDKKMIKSRTFENDEEAEEYYKAVKKHLDKVVYEEKKKYELHPLGDNYYHEQFADDDSGEEWRQSQE